MLMVMVQLLHKHVIERANATLLLALVWGGLAGCVLARWFTTSPPGFGW